MIERRTTVAPNARPAEFDRVVGEFQSSWTSGRRPVLEDYLSSHSDLKQPDFFRELLAVELHELRKSGARPDYQAYVDRFPAMMAVVDEQFMATESFKVSIGSTASRTEAADDTGPVEESRLAQIATRFRYIELLGRGGFGEVWKVYDELLSRFVALKGPRRDKAFTRDALDAFISEARKGAMLHQVCDGVVNVIDVVDDSGVCFIVMDYMRGGSLAQRIKEGPLPPKEAADLVGKLADILTAMHRENFVHRDIKPANVLFDELGNPHIGDLGLAATEDELLEEDDSVLGTLAYMPPEQAENRSNRADGRADIYSLGVLFYVVLTGRCPYLARNRDEYLRLLDDPDGPKPPRQIDHRIPPELERICLRCIERNAKSRYQTAADISRDIDRWRQSGKKKSWRNIVLVSSAVFLLAAFAGVAYRHSWDSGSRRPSGAGGRSNEEANLAADEVLGEQAEIQTLRVTPLIFPSGFYQGASNWDVIEDGRSLQVRSESESLLGLAEISPRETCTCNIEIDQLDWTGRVGVFVGFRKNASGNERYELIELHEFAGGYQWQRLACVYHRTNNNVTADTLAQYPIDGSPRGPLQLGIQITGGAVQAIELDGRPVAQLVAVHPFQQQLVDDAGGYLGVYNVRSEAVFSNVTMNGVKQTIRKPRN